VPSYISGLSYQAQKSDNLNPKMICRRGTAMSEHGWARVGQIGTALNALVGLGALGVTIFIYLTTPSSLLVADIRPMAFRLPITAAQLGEFTKPGQLFSAPAVSLLQVSQATSLVKIELHNNGGFPISAIRVNVASAVLYASETEGVDDSSSLPSDQLRTTIDNLTQGESMTVYVWTGTQAEEYRHWSDLDNQFKIIFLKVLQGKISI
jgi:hypothetical protein